ncbi:MAG TPA: hypothetical protein DCL95_10150 [Rhodospirillaceae bacterium]|nr:hypothetical protein [Rhodospirillaceae bacterium]MAX64326.1 hypothetical protein [Rhodospirillaceae bacterium]MBB58240.1 hypothetical protein [Rhodospirillaceae bacterium]HAE01241.1 hypothetical protein [Rhodospirillaceae bacterium]HAJ20400.1 hypothetical protein [Rhodospirillaceae bacterium]
MTVLEQVREYLIHKSPEPVCDDCITKALGLSIRQHANHKTRELSKTRQFDRRKDVCTICESVKEVTRYS